MAEKSWWLDAKRDEFTKQAEAEQPRMTRSPEAKHVNGMIVAWGKRK